MRIRKLIWIATIVITGLAQPLAFGQGTGPVVPARAEQSPLDQPLAWLTEAKRNFTAVKDYKCTLVSQERVKGELLPQNIIEMKVKSEPFGVYMRWLGPQKFAGQEVVYVKGKNGGKMKVKSNVIGGNLVGFVSVDTNDARVFQHSRHTILEAGIGNMIEENLKHWEISRRINKTKVSIGEFKYNDRNCIRVELTATQFDKELYCYRSVIFLEKESKIPIRLEIYNWPQQGGNPSGDLLESFSYVNLQFNTGIRDEEFNK